VDLDVVVDLDDYRHILLSILTTLSDVEGNLRVRRA
jgi:hypothetical protein